MADVGGGATFWAGDGSTQFERFVIRLAETAGLGEFERVELDEVRGSPDWLFEASLLAGVGDHETCCSVADGRTPHEAKYNLARHLLGLANAHAANLLGEAYRPLGPARLPDSRHGHSGVIRR